MKNNMYDEAQSWNPFKGCKFDCVYCRCSFQLQAKRQRQNCSLCAEYEPHFHPERLARIPSARIIFVCGNSDLSFATADVFEQVIQAIKDKGRPGQEFYFQSKQPECFEPYIKEFPENAILLTTLETNRDGGYEQISKAPPPSIRYEQFRSLDFPRKVLTLEPMLKFDHDILVEMAREIEPEYVWLGVNSKRRFKALQTLPEPTTDEFYRLYSTLKRLVDVKLKTQPSEGTHASDYQ